MREGSAHYSSQRVFPRLSVIDRKICGAVGADSHEAGMTDRKLSGESSDEV